MWHRFKHLLNFVLTAESTVRPTGLPMELKQEVEGSKPPGDRAGRIFKAEVVV